MIRSNQPDDWIGAVLPIEKWMRAPHDIDPGVLAIGLTEPNATEGLRVALHRARSGNVAACPRATTSVWTKHLFAALLPAPALHALAGRRFDGPPVLLIDNVRPVAMAALPPDRICATAEPQHLTDFLRSIADPLIRTLAKEARLAPRLLWSNAANFLAWLFEQWQRSPALAERSAAMASTLFDDATWPDGLANPLHRHVDYVPTTLVEYPVTRRRRLCCLRDRIGQPLCVTCPKISTEVRDAILRGTAP
jgi:ferric iron reductase protein FhuF